EIPLIKSENPNPEYLLSDHNFIKGKSCVVIDDNQTNLKIFKHLFKYWKMKSKEFESPDEGIKYIKFKNPIL
ncbi:MAG: hypothetical protein KDK36_20000, partial [Leptospiraceae bacterium]|nr:hypothetical protein [Leptospiraceae bacterium]